MGGPLTGVRVLEVVQRGMQAPGNPLTGAYRLEQYAEDVRFASLEAVGILAHGTGQWAAVQDAWETAHDESLTVSSN